MRTIWSVRTCSLQKSSIFLKGNSSPRQGSAFFSLFADGTRWNRNDKAIGKADKEVNMAFTCSVCRVVDKDPIRVVGENKTSVLHARVAEKKKSSLGKGKEEQESNFFDITIFGRRAEAFDELLEKGDPLYIQGELENNFYQKEDGTTVYRDQIIVREFSLIESKEQKKLRQRLAARRRAEAEIGEEDGEEDVTPVPAKQDSPKKAPARTASAKTRQAPKSGLKYKYEDDDDFL